MKSVKNCTLGTFFKQKKMGCKMDYPNPIYPSDKIEYQIPELSKDKLFVYDILGSENKILDNEEKPADSHEVEFDCLRSPSGIETDKFFDTKKFILLK